MAGEGTVVDTLIVAVELDDSALVAQSQTGVDAIVALEKATAALGETVGGAAAATVQMAAQTGTAFDTMGARVDRQIVLYQEMADGVDVANEKAIAAFEKASAAVSETTARLGATKEQTAQLAVTYNGVKDAAAAYAAALEKVAQAGRSDQIDLRIAKLREQADVVEIIGLSSVKAFTKGALATEQWAIALGATGAQLAELGAAIQVVENRAVAMGVRGISEVGNLQAAALKATGSMEAEAIRMDKSMESGAQQMNMRWGMAAMAIAGATDSLARQEAIGGRAMKTIIRQASMAAFFFGPEGAIVGAIALTTLAVIDLFGKMDKEAAAAIDRLNKKIDEQRRKQGGPTGEASRDVVFATTEQAKATIELANAEKILADVRKTNPLTGKPADVFAVAVATGQVDEARKALAHTTLQLQTAELGLTEARAAAQKDVAHELARSESLGLSTPGQKVQSLQMEADLRRQIHAITGSDIDSIRQRNDLEEALMTLISARTKIERAGERDAASAAKAAAALEKAKEGARTAQLAAIAKDLAAYQKSVADLGNITYAAFSESLGSALDRQEADFSKKRSKMITDLVSQGVSIEHATSAADEALAALRAKLDELEKLHAQALANAGDLSKHIVVPAEMQRLIDKPIPGQKTAAQIEAETLKQQNKERAELVTHIIEAAHAALQLADAFGHVDQRTRAAVEGVLQLAGAIKSFVKGDILSGIIQSLGALGSLAGVLKDPNTAARQKDLAENTVALRELGRHLGDFLTVTMSGHNVASVTAAVKGMLDLSGSAGGFHKFTGEGQYLEAKTGLSFKEIADLAAQLGIKLDGTKQSYLDFYNALTKADLAAWTDTFAGAMDRLAAIDQASGTTDPTARVLERIKIFTDPKTGAPAIATALAGLDVSSTTSRAAAIANLINILKNSASLTPEELGGMNLEQFKQSILDTIDGLRGLNLDPLTVLSNALSVLDERLAGLGATPLDDFNAQLKLLQGTLTTFAGVTVANVKDRFAQFLDTATADGTIDPTERAVIDGFKALIASMDAAGAAADANAAKVLADAEATRVATNALADRNTKISNFMTDQPSGGTVRGDTTALLAKSPIVAQLFQGADFSTVAGLTAFRESIKTLIRSIIDGTAPVEKFGTMTGPELIDALMGIGDAATTAAGTIAGATVTILGAVNQVQHDAGVLGLSAQDTLSGETGAASSASPSIANYLKGLDLTTVEGRTSAIANLRSLWTHIHNNPNDLIDGQKGSEVIGTVEKLISDLVSFDSGSTTGSSAGGGSSASAGGSSVSTSGISSVTETQAFTLVDLGRSQLLAQQQMVTLLDQLVGGGGRIGAPAIGGLYGGSGGGMVFAPSINYYGPVSFMGSEEQAAALAEQLTPLVGTFLGNSYQTSLQARGVR